jgi:hypothetical protein
MKFSLLAPKVQLEGSQTYNVWNEDAMNISALKMRTESGAPSERKSTSLAIPDVARLATFSKPLARLRQNFQTFSGL